MGTILIDTLLSACVKRRAGDLKIAIGQAPLMRIGGQTQMISDQALTTADVAGIVESITPQRCRQELEEAGQTRFDFGFGTAARVHAVIIQRAGIAAMKLQLSLS